MDRSTDGCSDSENLQWLQKRCRPSSDGARASAPATLRHTEEDEDDEDEDILPVTAGALLHSKPGAWQIFLGYANDCFPRIRIKGCEDCGMASLGRGRDLRARAAQKQKAELLRSTCEKVSASMSASLQKLRRSQKGPLLSATSAPSFLRDSCQLQALAALQEIELSNLRIHNQSMLQDLQVEVARCNKVNDILCELSKENEDLAQHRLLRDKARKAHARRILGRLEDVCSRLRELKARKAALILARRLRTCYAEETGSHRSVLVFRGQHRLHIFTKSGCASSFCVRFQPFFPGARLGSSPHAEATHGEVLKGFEEFLCRIFMRAVDPQLGSVLKAEAVVDRTEIADVLHRLQMGLIDAADLVRDIVKRMMRTRLLPGKTQLALMQ